jgi:hypothetical protein
MPENQPRKRAPGGGRRTLPTDEKKRRVQLYLSPALAAYLEAEDLPTGLERKRAARKRKQEAATLLQQANIEK